MISRANLVARYVVAVVIGIVAASLLLVQQGEGPGTLVRLIWQATGGSTSAPFDLMRWTTPLLIGGLAFLVAVRGGMWNLGIEGQICIGALAAAICGVHMPGPPLLAVPAGMVAGMVAGALWAWPIAWLHARRGINEIVLTLMFNYVAVYLAKFVVREFFIARRPDGSVGQTISTYPIRDEARLPVLITSSAASWAVFVALAVYLVVCLAVLRTKIGFDLRAVGDRPSYARYRGIDVPALKLRAFCLSGALGGLVGATEVHGVVRRFMDGAFDQMGFDSMIVSLVALNHPIAVLPSALFFGALKNAELVIAQTVSASSYVVLLVSAIFICVFVSNPFARTLTRISTLLSRRGADVVR